MVVGTYARPPKQERLETSASTHQTVSERPTCRLGLRGLFNSGNTCYCNAALQACLLHNPAVILYATECKAFYQDLVQHTRAVKSSSVYALTKETMNLLQRFATTEATPLYPKELLACIRSNNVEFAGGVQHDSSLFLKYLLECLHEATKQLVSDPREKSGLSELQRESGNDSEEEECMTEEEKMACPLWSPPSNYNEREVSFISEIFRGRLLNEVSCHGCGYISRRRELFWDLAVEVPYGKRSIHHFQNAATKFRSDQSFDSFEYLASDSQRVVRRKRANSSLGISLGSSHHNNDNNNNSPFGGFMDSKSQWLGWLLSPFRDVIDLRTILCHFFVPEDIVKSEYKCAKCRKSTQTISRKSSLIELPETLVITLKRFRYEGNRGFKVSTHVVFPMEELDLGQFLAVDAMYEKKNCSTRYYLGGVVCHKGSLSSGHYIAYVRIPIAHSNLSDWYELDDACVRPISSNEVESASSQAYVLVYYKYPLESTQLITRKYKLELQHILLSPSSLFPYLWKADQEQSTSAPAGTSLVSPNNNNNNNSWSSDDTSRRMILSRLWVWRLLSFSYPGPISNDKDLLCPHGHIIDTEQVSLWKDKCYIVEESLWKELYSLYGGGPSLLLDEVSIGCDACLCRLQQLEQRRKEEKETVQSLSRHEKSVWYLIDAQWWNKWQTFCMGYEKEPPGPITNGRLIRRDGKPVKGLSPLQDYKGVNSAVWNYLHSIYGGYPEIKRQSPGDIYSSSPSSLG